ncbi:potassium transporter [Mycolicibacterium goodii]
MNALFVASRYLGRDQRVILIDRRGRVGGMWVDTYDYVRLHQPHPMFTAGDIEWTLGRERAYLATKGEVLAHFEHCLAEIGRRVAVDTRFGWEFVSDKEFDGDTGVRVRIECRAPDGTKRVIEAARLIKAYGVRVVPNRPLELSSTRVRSVSPDSCDVRRGDIHDGDAPVWIIGGGKTGMDTAHTLITDRPGREVNLVAGSGTYFASRDKFFPTGIRRWIGGQTLNSMAEEMCRRFDGTNEREVTEWFRGEYGVWLTPQTGNYLLGVLSEAENTTIAKGLRQVLMDHLVDVVDRDGAAEMVLRSGATRRVDDGSWIVNCTGYLLKGDGHPYEPYLSPGGSVLSIQPRSATMHLNSYAAYFMTHLFLTDKLADLPLYEVDLIDLWRDHRAVVPFTVFTLVQYNLGLMADVLPTKVFGDCGLDFARWYPWHRRTAAGVHFMRTHRQASPHLRRTLDTVHERFGVRCGPLQRQARASAVAAG